MPPKNQVIDEDLDDDLNDQNAEDEEHDSDSEDIDQKDVDDDEDDQDEDDEDEEQDSVSDSDDSDSDKSDGSDSDSDDSEFTVSIEGEPQEDDSGGEDFKGPAPKWVAELRKSNRQIVKENKELKRRLELQAQAEAPAKLTEKPTLAECDYDEEDYAEKLLVWERQKQQAEKKAEEARKAEAAQQQAWQNELKRYEESKASFKASDFQDVEDQVADKLDQTKQSVLVKGAKNPAALIYALGKHPKVLDSLASENDLVKFAFQVARIEEKLKVERKSPPPKPEKRVKSRSSATSGGDRKLEKLREEAEETGNYSKVMEYRRKMRKKSG